MEQVKSATEQDKLWRNGALKAVLKFILNPRETDHNYKLYINSSKRYKTFEEQLKKESGRHVELLMSGSMAESLFATHWVYKDGKREAKNDIDIMLVDFSMKVVESWKSVSRSAGSAFGNDFPAVQNSHLSMAELFHPMNGKCCDQKNLPLMNTDMSPTGSIQNGSRSENNFGDSINSLSKLELKEDTQKDLFLETTDRPGYIQLHYEQREEGNPTLLSTENFKDFWREIVNKTALYSLVSGPQLPSGGVVATGPALNRRDRPSMRNNYAHDYVPCLQCPEWPSLANKWPERSRTVGWPSKDLISDILSKGCHVVPVSHHDSTLHNTEWRLSFSLAEKMLVHAMSREQRQSYVVAKLIMKHVIQEIKDNALPESTPSSYHLKTILLWKCEEKNLEEWHNILNSAVQLLESFVDHLLRGNILNYFIPENNMVSHISHQDLVSVANGITTSLNDLPATLYKVFQAAYETLLDFDDAYSSVLRLVNRQLKIFCQTGTVGNKLYLCYILNSLVDSLSAAIVGTSNELHHLQDHKHILNIYCTHHIAAGSPLTLPTLTPPVWGAAERCTTVKLLFQYLHTLLQNEHILSNLQNDIFAILSRVFTGTLVAISLNLSEEISRDCCKESLRVYQSVCKQLKLEQSSCLSCREELSTLYGLDYIFSQHPELAEMETFAFASQRFQKLRNDGQIEKVKSLEW